MKRLIATTAALTVAAGLVSALPASADQGAASRAAFIGLRAKLSGKCVDADLNTAGQDGTRIQLWDCNQEVQQRFNNNLLGNGQSVIQAHVNNKCLDADDGGIGGNGTRVQLWRCNHTTNQRWIIFHRPDGMKIKNVRSGRCLDVDPAHVHGNGTELRLWDCNDQPQQRWL